MKTKLLLTSIIATSVLFTGCGDTDKVKEETPKVEDIVKDIKTLATNKTQEAKEIVSDKYDDAKKVVSSTIEKTKDIVVNKAAEIQDVVASKSVTQLYAPCIGCHGATSQNKALGKSAIIKGWSEDKIYTALVGYKDGSYGGAMKGIMKGQVSKLSNTEIKTLSTYISKF